MFSLDDIPNYHTRMLVSDLHSEFPNISARVCYAALILDRHDYDAAFGRLSTRDGQVVVDDLQVLLDSPREKESALRTMQIIVSGLPAEIWHIICSSLSSEDIRTARLVCKSLATTAARFLVKTVHLDTSFAAVKKLQTIAQHREISTSVETLTFDSALWQDVGCIHNFTERYKTGLIGAEPLTPVKENATPRERRAINRQEAKIVQAAEVAWAARSDVLSMQSLITDASDEEKRALFSTVSCLPKLRTLNFVALPCTGHRNCDTTSAYRGTLTYGDHPFAESLQTVWQLQSLLTTGLQTLKAMYVSTYFFNGEGIRTQVWLKDRFSSLTSILLHFGPTVSKYGLPVVEDNVSKEIAVLQSDLLKDALQSALQLNELRLEFGLATVMRGPRLSGAIDVSHKWKKLRKLSLAGFTTTAAELYKIFHIHTALTHVDLEDLWFEKGTWKWILNRLATPKHERLEHFYTQGYLKDSTKTYFPDHCEEAIWVDEHLDWSLSTAIECFVTDWQSIVAFSPEELAAANPLLESDTYAPRDYLYDAYGPCENDSDFGPDF